MLELLQEHVTEIRECVVSEAMMERIDNSALTRPDLDQVLSAGEVRPSRLYDYIHDVYEMRMDERANPWRRFPAAMHWRIIDARILDLAKAFF